MLIRAMFKARFMAALAAVELLAAMMMAHGAYSLDASLPAYRPVEALSGRLKSVGSDTLGHETEAWAKAFEKLYPDVKVEIEAAGSATAPTALVEGRAQKKTASFVRSLARTLLREATAGWASCLLCNETSTMGYLSRTECSPHWLFGRVQRDAT